MGTLLAYGKLLLMATPECTTERQPGQEHAMQGLTRGLLPLLQNLCQSFTISRWYGSRRLCELLEEQQEPFLLVNHGAKEAGLPGSSIYCSCKNDRPARRRSALGRGVIRRAVRLVGCFSCGAHGTFFQRLPRPGDTGGGRCDDDAVTEFDDGGRRLSPISVLDVLRHYADEESSSPTHSSWEEEEEDDMPPSTQGSSPSPDPLTGAATSRSFTLHADDDRTCAHAPEATTTRSEEVQRIISSWERIARVPMLAELDLSSTWSAPRNGGASCSGRRLP
ncbi:hypothetical protein QYE76_000392 [Lolium multiflorum]|uniref:Uncharacterized protein n=1 Tax=Lolium multiflorum TaxID=4521 RepID=A0AAD8RK34_LOLMU|nr:hypothetical protein QYE76_000392 [Lolium multiflorum]